MKDNNIIKGIGEVSEEVLERYHTIEADLDNAKKQRIRSGYIISASLSLLLIVSLMLPHLPFNSVEPPLTAPTSHPTNTITSTPQSTQSSTTVLPATEETPMNTATDFSYPEVVKYGVYIETPSYDGFFNPDKVLDVALKKLPEINYEWDTFKASPQMTPELSEQIKNGVYDLKLTEFFGNKIDYEVISSSLRISDFSKCPNPYLRDDRLIGRFKCKNIANEKEFTVTVDFKTNKILYYYDSAKLPQKGSFSLNKAKQKAVEIVEAEFGKDALDTYAISYEERRDDCFIIRYSRMIGDYSAQNSDFIEFKFDREGKVVSYSVRNFGKLVGVLDILTEENLKKAEDAFVAALPEKIYLSSKYKSIVIDKDTGVCYIKISIDGNDYYINVY